MRKSIIVNLLPIALEESTHQKQECALRLMEIGDQHLHNLILIARSNDNLRAGMESLQAVAVQIIDDCLDSLHRSDSIYQIAIFRKLVRIPLFYVQIFFICLRMLQQMNAHVIEALDGTNAGCSYGNDPALVLDEFFQTAAMNNNVFRMHLMAFDFKTLHRFECAGSYMQGYFFAVDSMRIKILENSIGKMKSGSWSSHTSLDFRINRLIGGLVALLCLAVEIWRNRQLAYCFENLSERHLVVVPIEVNPVVGSSAFGNHFLRFRTESISASHGGAERKLVALDFEITLQASLFPFLQITDHAEPGTMSGGLEHEFIISRFCRLHQENLNKRTCFLAEVQTRLYHLGIVEYHQGSLREICGKMMENIIAYLAVLIDQQFAVVALGNREFCDALIR